MSNNHFQFVLVRKDAGSAQSAVAKFTWLPEGSVVLSPVFSTEGAGKPLGFTGRRSMQAVAEGFKAEKGQTLAGMVSTGSKSCYHLSFGVGKESAFSLAVWQAALIGAFKKARELHTHEAVVTIPRSVVRLLKKSKSGSLYEFGRATASTIARVLYEPEHFKTEAGGFKPSVRVETVSVSGVGLTPVQQNELESGLKHGEILGSAVILSRNTANLPPNICTPTYMAELAESVAAGSDGTISVEVFEGKDCAHFGMNAFLAVARGAKEPPKFIVMTYTPKVAPVSAEVLGLVGKAVTFDAGGLDIKPADGMRDMKYDMCGGASVIAAMQAIAAMGLPVSVKAFIAATENMTGSDAYKPGDVYVGMDGKSYEIDNTDAEGRLTLVDAISYARLKGGVTRIVDYATLTGAVLIALGDAAAGVVTSHQDWCDAYLAAAKASGENVHQFPIYDDYREQNKSDIADLKNTGGRLAGSITAGLFVMSAAGDLPIVHVDIAGTAFRSRATGADPKGGTGFGVLSLVALAEGLAA